MGFSDKKKNKPAQGKRSLIKIFIEGDIYSKLSFIIMGLSNIVRGQLIKGLIYLGIEVSYIMYMVTAGVNNIANMISLGTKEQGWVPNPDTGILERIDGDNSMMFLLWGVVTCVISFAFVCAWLVSIFSGEQARLKKVAGKEVPGIVKDIKSLFDKNIHKLLLAVPVIGISVFTVMPLVYMILIAFTNYDGAHQPPGKLFTWVGIDSFQSLIASSGKLASTFWPVFGWTIIWGFLATFTCYFGGMFLAILINSKGIHGKKVWRTIFVITMAIPAFISLLVVRTMLGSQGIINILLEQWGFIRDVTTDALPFLTNATWARVTIVVVNMWIGIPVTMLMVSGILTNIPVELYESAKLDGASPWVMFKKITFPYMWFITTPYLISNLMGNFNNFNVIYFLTAGDPKSLEYYSAGKTDLLVTWLYKLTKDQSDYNIAAAISIIIFVISATITLISFTRSKALKNEEGFQ